LRRFAKLALGPPSRKRLLAMWAREFDVEIPGQLYETGSLTDEQIRSARQARNS